MRAHRYWNDEKLTVCSEKWLYPLISSLLVTLIMVKFGGADSMRVVPLLAWSNHVSDQSKNTSLWVQIRFFIKNDFFKGDIMFRTASFTICVGGVMDSCWYVTFNRLDRFTPYTECTGFLLLLIWNNSPKPNHKQSSVCLPFSHHSHSPQTVL